MAVRPVQLETVRLFQGRRARPCLQAENHAERALPMLPASQHAARSGHAYARTRAHARAAAVKHRGVSLPVSSEYLRRPCVLGVPVRADAAAHPAAGQFPVSAAVLWRLRYRRRACSCFDGVGLVPRLQNCASGVHETSHIGTLRTKLCTWQNPHVAPPSWRCLPSTNR